MRIIHLFTATLLFIPVVTSAQEREFDDHSVVYNSTNSQRFEDVTTDCEWAAPFIPEEIIGGARSELYAIETDPGSGEKVADGELVGEMWQCFSDGRPRMDPALGQSGEQTVAFALLLDDVTLGGLGTVSPATQNGFPQAVDGMALFAASAILVEVVGEGADAAGDTLGAMSFTVFSNPTGIEGYNGAGLNGLVTLRMFTPRDYNREAFIDAISRAFK